MPDLPGRMKSGSGRQFLLFVLTGGAAALVNVFSRVGFSQVLRFELGRLWKSQAICAKNTPVIVGTVWVHGQQAARLALHARLRLQ